MFISQPFRQIFIYLIVILRDIENRNKRVSLRIEAQSVETPNLELVLNADTSKSRDFF